MGNKQSQPIQEKKFYKKTYNHEHQYIIDINQDYELCFMAVKENPLNLQFVESYNQTNEICLMALLANGLTLKFIKYSNCPITRNHNNNDDKLYKLSDIEIFQDSPLNPALNYVIKGASPYYNNNKYEELCEVAIQQNPLALEFVEPQTKKLCLLALNLNGLALKHIKRSHFTSDEYEELYEVAIQQNPLAIDH